MDPNLNERFRSALYYVNNGLAKKQFPNKKPPTNEQRLYFYSHYKQAMFGDCNIKKPKVCIFTKFFN